MAIRWVDGRWYFIVATTVGRSCIFTHQTLCDISRRNNSLDQLASADWDGALNSWFPVSSAAMGRWMLEEAGANKFVRAARSCRAAVD
jgi:hypothetical protein